MEKSDEEKIEQLLKKTMVEVDDDPKSLAMLGCFSLMAKVAPSPVDAISFVTDMMRVVITSFIKIAKDKKGARRAVVGAVLAQIATNHGFKTLPEITAVVEQAMKEVEEEDEAEAVLRKAKKRMGGMN
jgi:hypothetical protein